MNYFTTNFYPQVQVKASDVSEDLPIDTGELTYNDDTPELDFE